MKQSIILKQIKTPNTSLLLISNSRIRPFEKGEAHVRWDKFKMIRDDLKAVIDEFIDLIENGSPSIKQNESRLNRYLDELSIGLQVKSTTFADIEYPDPPQRNQNDLRNLVCSRFPNYGFYNVPENTLKRIGESGVVVGDAIDDIVDIANNLYDVAWRWEHNEPDDAIWCYYTEFISHWGSHLRFLQLYIHLSKYGE